MTYAPNLDYRVKHAIDVIYDQYGDTVSVDQKKKDLRKFGQNLAIGTSVQTLMTLPSGEVEESYISTNAITSISSSSALDNQYIEFIEGHTRSGTDLTFVKDSTSIQLNGQTSVALNTNFNRTTRFRLTAPASGTIYVHRGGATSGGVPTDTKTIHAMIPIGEIETQKASTAISSVDYWLINSACVSVLSKTACWVQARVEIKPITSNYFYPISEWVSATDSSGKIELFSPDDPLLIVPPNHDVRIAIYANTSNIQASGGITGMLAIII